MDRLGHVCRAIQRLARKYPDKLESIVKWLAYVIHDMRGTYKGLRWYYNKTRAYRHLEWHTVERNIRRLAENKWLSRRILPHRGVKHVVFCLTSNLEYVLSNLGWLK